jgi:hypothetical protein
MKINLTKLYLTKLSCLANKFHQNEASIKDLEQLRLLVNAFHTHVNINERLPLQATPTKN